MKEKPTTCKKWDCENKNILHLLLNDVKAASSSCNILLVMLYLFPVYDTYKNENM